MLRYFIMRKAEFTNRIFGLDLLRCLAVLMVLTEHGIAAYFDARPFKALILFFAEYGVDLFFVLSGFLIGSIIIKIVNKDEKVTFADIRIFWIRRWFRTLPNYLLFMILYYLLNLRYAWPVPYDKLLLYFLFLQNAFKTMPDFYKISWSLTIEEWFYLLLPLILVIVQAILKINKKNIIVFSTLVLIITCLALRLVLAFATHSTWDEGTRMLMPGRLDSIAMGVCIAILKFYKHNVWYNYKNLMAILGCTILVINSFAFYNTFIQKNHLYGNLYMNTFFFTISPIALALLIPWFYYVKLSPKFKAIDYSVTTISLISYSIYLMHPLVRDVLKAKYGHVLNGITLFIMLYLFTFIGSYFTYNFFEKQITKLREGFGTKKDAVHI